jgi:hypothetical protein
MKRSGFKRPALVSKDRSEEFTSYQAPKTSARIAAILQPAESRPKQEPVRSEAYRRLVAALPCAYCHRPGPSQAAHANEGKGMGIKTDDRTCFPMCGPGFHGSGCHSELDQGGLFKDKETRRGWERMAGVWTRARIQADGNWPKGLPYMEGDV